MLVLYDCAAGYAVFQVLNPEKFEKPEHVADYFAQNNDPNEFYRLLAFHKFANTKEALTAATNTHHGESNTILESTINEVIQKGMKEQLAVSDVNIGHILKNKLHVENEFTHGEYVRELLRGISANHDSLLTGVSEEDMNALQLGLAHSISRYKLKFSPDKVDTMIVHAIALNDELDKELNNYAMRMKEWYGWHFPELAKVVPDSVTYAKLIREVGFRDQFVKTEIDFLSEDVDQQVKKLAEISMGTEISVEDITNISYLAEQVIDLSQYRDQLNTYLRERMRAIAPNLSEIVGELVGARLISHAGSLVNLAKHPASTVQILGAEKALFRAMKTKQNTPKYGLIYHASLVSQCSVKNKGKVSRQLAAKAALASRYDALSDESNCQLALEALSKLHHQFYKLEGKNPSSTGAVKTPVKQDTYTNVSTVVRYEPTDSTLPDAKTDVKVVKTEPNLLVTDGNLQAAETSVKKEKKKKKKKKAAAAAAEAETPEVVIKIEPMEAEEAPEAPKSEKKKKKKKKSAATEVKVEVKEEPVEAPEPAEPKSEKKKKKKRKAEAAPEAEGEGADSNVEVKKKKKKKKVAAETE